VHCENKKAYFSAEQAGRVAGLRQADGAPQLHPYECPECGCFHLSKMDRLKVVGLGLNAKRPAAKIEPEPSPTADQRIKEATSIIRAERGNFIGCDSDGSRWLVRLSSGEMVVAHTTGNKPKVKAIDDPGEEARTMYPSLFVNASPPPAAT